MTYQYTLFQRTHLTTNTIVAISKGHLRTISSKMICVLIEEKKNNFFSLFRLVNDFSQLLKSGLTIKIACIFETRHDSLVECFFQSKKSSLMIHPNTQSISQQFFLSNISNLHTRDSNPCVQMESLKKTHTHFYYFREIKSERILFLDNNK